MRAENHTLFALMVFSGVAAAVAYALRMQQQYENSQLTDTTKRIEADGRPSGRVEASHGGRLGGATLPATFPKKGFKYLQQNQTLVDIVQDIRVLRLLDQSKYSDILLVLNQLQKVYIYILAGRYDPYVYIPIFMDTRDAALELFYGMIFVMPSTFSHVYGIRPYDLMHSNIRRLTAATRTMADVLRSYAEKTAGTVHIPDVLHTPSPYDSFDPMRPLRLP